MAYQKFVYKSIQWINKSDGLSTPVGKNNLNHMDRGIYNIAENLDIVRNELSAGKFDEADAGKVIVGMPTWNPETGVLAFRFYDGTTFQVDFNVEKIPVSFSMDSAGVITMTTADGTQWTADIGDAIPTYAYRDSDTITFSDVKDGSPGHLISAQIKKNSITGEHLRPDYLADVMVQASNAAACAQSASDYADHAEYDAKLAQSYSVGGSGVREGEAADNAKTYKEQAESAAKSAQAALDEMQDVPAAKLANARTIDGVRFDGTANITHVGNCKTEPGTVEKTVSIDNFTLKDGAAVIVWFEEGNTAERPRLNVNGTGAKEIAYKFNYIWADSAGIIEKNGVYLFVYKSSWWHLVGDVGIRREAQKAVQESLSGIFTRYAVAGNEAIQIDNLSYGDILFVSSIIDADNATFSYCLNGGSYQPELKLMSGNLYFVNLTCRSDTKSVEVQNTGGYDSYVTVLNHP